MPAAASLWDAMENALRSEAGSFLLSQYRHIETEEFNAASR